MSILCRFSDSQSVTPYPKRVVRDAHARRAAPSLDHFWREVSFGTVSLTGSVVFGWYAAATAVYYVYGNPPQLDTQRAAEAAQGVADAAVSFPDFVGINMMFNDDLDCCAWGGSTSSTSTASGVRTHRPGCRPGATRPGPDRARDGTWLRTPHSSGPYGATYDSRWDVVSDVWGNCPV